jgi:hypothetical protein
VSKKHKWVYLGNEVGTGNHFRALYECKTCTFRMKTHAHVDFVTLDVMCKRNGCY